MQPADFRAAFPEFADPVAYPDATIAMWIAVAGLRLNATRWGALLTIGTQFFVAHNLVLSAQAAKAAAAGGVPGAATGVVASKSVEAVSVSYDTNLGAIDGAGQYNLTSYGRQFYELMDLVGMGGQQLAGEQVAAGSVVAGGWTAGFLVG